MTTLRERIQAVLRTHTLRYPNPGEGMTSILDDEQRFVQDLLNCFNVAAPSWDELDKIFLRHSHQYPSAAVWEQAIKHDLMAWARGEKLTPVWCVHIYWDESEKGEWDVRWKFSTPDPMRVWVPPSWDQCPVNGCHAKRPSS